MSAKADKVNPHILHIGAWVKQARKQKKLNQDELAQQVGCHRNDITHLEQGRRMPRRQHMLIIGDILNLSNQGNWQIQSHPMYIDALGFQSALAELVGKPLSMGMLDEVSQMMLIESISRFISQDDERMSLKQAMDHFNSILTFYGELPVKSPFYKKFLGQSNFKSLAQFQQRVHQFQADAIRIYGSFKKAFKSLSKSEEIEADLQALKPIPPHEYHARRPFESILPIPRERLDDLGYISAERVRTENKERHKAHQLLMELAHWYEKHPHKGFDAAKKRRIQSLLRQFESELRIEDTLFDKVNPDEIRREAHRLAPEDQELINIAQTQEKGLRNLSAYLTEPYMDVYIATSMRERADFISVNTFVETIFHDPQIAPLHLRYFNPTLSWISDRVAKGLVEALMLKRSSLTVYMAQKGDTFGKDSEASVALGQGKPVIVYVPRLYFKSGGIDSEELMHTHESRLRNQLLNLNPQWDEELDKAGMVNEILKLQLQKLNDTQLMDVINSHWADFDLYGELKHMAPELVHEVNMYLDDLTLHQLKKPVPEHLRAPLIERLVAVAYAFEKRAHTFKEIHPLALQVIVSTGVLNGILVVRSAASCTKMIYELLTNSIQTELKVEKENYRLIEKHTGSTLRVISKNKLLINAFWTQYFE